jgi:hypothetical protein
LKQQTTSTTLFEKYLLERGGIDKTTGEVTLKAV